MRSPQLVRLALLAGASILPVVAGCKQKDAAMDAPFSDSFDRAALGDDWRDTSASDPARSQAAYRIADGKLNVANAYNHPLWLRRRLPADVVIDVDVMSRSAAGDIKVEPFGDGTSFDPDKGGYVSTGYMLIFGGWHNSLSVICRNNEHDDGRKTERSDVKVEPGRWYHWTITRKGGLIDWQMDGHPFLAWTDPQPLAGEGHDHFAVNNWEADVWLDNLKIRPAP